MDSDQWAVDSGEEEEPEKNPALGGQESALSPAMRRWVGMLEAGYTIRARRAWRKKEGGLTWRPALYNPEGAFVQMVRLDTAQRLEALGLIKMQGGG